MPHLIVTPEAAQGMARCRRYLLARSAQAAKRADRVIAAALTKLAITPELGRLYEKDRSLRELLIPFGKGAYLALYRHEAEADVVRILAFRHGREAQYHP